MADTDEAIARKLQEQFDKEAKEAELQCAKDSALAQVLASGSHEVSDSDNEEETHNDVTEENTNNKSRKSPQSLTSSVICINTEKLTESVKRPVCKYGAYCYRKSSIHLLEFYHPEKSDSSPGGNSSNGSVKKRKKSELGNSCSTQMERKLFDERLNMSDPFRFFLNKIYSLPETKNDWQTLVFPDLLNSRLGTVIESVQLNFMLNLNFVMDFYKIVGIGHTPVLFMYGEMEGNPSEFQKVTCNKVKMPFQYGVHHTKMMIFHYQEGMRVVIHTANLIPDDWEEKTQGFWISPLFPPLAPTPGSGSLDVARGLACSKEPVGCAVGDFGPWQGHPRRRGYWGANGKKSLLDGESRTGFKRDLVDYLLSYKNKDLARWSHIVEEHDFSSCTVYLISSVPGYHVGESRFKFGHMKCRNLLRKGSNWGLKSSSPVVVQCSSIGSLGKEAKTWLTSELGSSLSGGNETTRSTVHLIYPSHKDVMESTQSFQGGSCLPYQLRTHEKQLWLLQHLHSWRSDCRLRTRSMPHIKTYTRLSEDKKEAQYFMLTSSNLSKAAWGQLQKNGTQIFIRSYEIGVMWLPQVVSGVDSFQVKCEDSDESDSKSLNLPYDLPLTPYNRAKDRPWLMDGYKL